MQQYVNPSSSFLQCLLEQTQAVPKEKQNRLEFRDDKPRLRMSVMGPSQCAKTSLAMDLAYSIAAETTTAATLSSSDIGYGDKSCRRRGMVLFLIPECKKAFLEFPMRCQKCQIRTTISSSSTDSGSNNNRNSSSNSIRASTSNSQQYHHGHLQHHEFVGQQCWDENLHKQGLQDIQIKYISSVLELVHCLASLGNTFEPHSSRGALETTAADDAGADASISNCTSSSEKDCGYWLNAIVIDDLDCYIREEGYQEEQQEEGRKEHDDGNGFVRRKWQQEEPRGKQQEQEQEQEQEQHRQQQEVQQEVQQEKDRDLEHDSTCIVHDTHSVRDSITVAEMQKLIQLLALLTDAANGIEERMQQHEHEPGTKNHAIMEHRGIHILTTINTDRLPLGTCASQIQGVISLMQNYTPSVVCIEPMKECAGQDESGNVALDRFFGKKHVGWDQGKCLLKLQSTWKIKLHHVCDNGVVEYAHRQGFSGKGEVNQRIIESKFCTGMRLRHTSEGSYANLLSYMEENEELYWHL